MKCTDPFQQSLHTDFCPSAWGDGALMPRNLNIPRSNPAPIKTLRAMNRKQFLHRRRKHEKNDLAVEQMLPLRSKNKVQLSPQQVFQKSKQDNFSSITQLKQHMHNLQKIRNRWNENESHRFYENIHKEVCSSRIAHTRPSEEANFERTQTIIKEFYSCRNNTARPVSSIKDSTKRSMTLAQRSKTIHSRCSKRSISSKATAPRPKNKSHSHLNITINQLQTSKMKSILQILINH